MDTFTFTYQDPKFTNKRIVLGNGYFGIDISNNYGQGFGLCEPKDPFPTSYLGGVYSSAFSRENRLDALFRPMNLFTLIPDFQDSEDLYGSLQQFTQSINMKTALATSNGLWDAYPVSTEIFLCRNFPHVGVLSLEITGKHTEGGKIEFPTMRYIVQKDPRVKYENMEIKSNRSNGSNGKITQFIGQIKEDKYEFEQKGNYTVIQNCMIFAFDEKNEIIPIKMQWDEFGDLNEGYTEYGEERNQIMRITPDLSETSPIKITYRVYFGIFKSSDVSGDLAQYSANYLEDVATRPYNLVKEAHMDAWQNEIWDSWIEVTDSELQKRINASMYYLACSFKAGFNNSAGPTGINNHAWEGHIFWDADLWMNLGLIMWAPELSRCITEFRYDTLNGAFQHRKDYVEEYEYEGITEGAKFPWQATSSGVETSPPGWEAQEHISCDVIYGQNLYYLATLDDTYLREKAFPIAFEIIKYFNQRLELKEDGKYHLDGVVPADEFPFPNHVSDNAFTNLYIEICYRIVIKWAKKLGKEVPSDWTDKIGKIFFNFDEQEQRVIEFTGYQGQKIKQADTNLLTFPLEYPFSAEIRRNNMLYYFSKLPENKIMMGSSVFSVIASELEMKEKAWEYFQDLYPHFHPEQAYIPSESPTNTCWPFLTGIGGFMFNLINGFGGVRLREDGILMQPLIPDQLNPIVYHQLFVQEKRVKLEISLDPQGNTQFSITNRNAQSWELRLYFKTWKRWIPENIQPLWQPSKDHPDEESYVLLFTAKEKITFIYKGNE